MKENEWFMQRNVWEVVGEGKLTEGWFLFSDYYVPVCIDVNYLQLQKLYKVIMSIN